MTSHLSLCELGSITQGQKVFTMGYPVPGLLGSAAKYTEGVISSMTGLKDEASNLQVTVPIQPGNSGGALVAPDGSVVGLVTSSVRVGAFLGRTGTLPQNVNWAVNADYLRAFLGELEGISQASVGAEGQRTSNETIAFVRRATCLIEAKN